MKKPKLTIWQTRVLIYFAYRDKAESMNDIKKFFKNRPKGNIGNNIAPLKAACEQLCTGYKGKKPFLKKLGKGFQLNEERPPEPNRDIIRIAYEGFGEDFVGILTRGEKKTLFDWFITLAMMGISFQKNNANWEPDSLEELENKFRDLPKKLH